MTECYALFEKERDNIYNSSCGEGDFLRFEFRLGKGVSFDSLELGEVEMAFRNKVGGKYRIVRVFEGEIKTFSIF